MKEQTDNARRRSRAAHGSADFCLKVWAGISAMALVAWAVCIATANGDSAISAAIIFAASIYGYEHEV